MIRDSHKLNTPLLDIFPNSWKEVLGKCENLEFRNITHFKNVVSKLTQRDDNKCDISYKDALSNLIKGKSDTTFDQVETVQKLVKANLLKRGLITQEVYEDFKYADSGTQVGVDVAKFTAGDPNCVITPSRQYINFFYELYISISYSAYTPNSKIMENVVRLLATIEELERQKIFIKITLVLPVRSVNYDGTNFFISVPLFSHNETKTAKSMCSVINDKLLRKFCFAIFEDVYGSELKPNYGSVVELDKCLNLGHEFDEVKFFTLVKSEVGAE